MSLAENIVPYNLKRRLKACRLKGRYVSKVSEINEVFVEILKKELVEEGKPIAELAAELEYSTNGLIKTCQAFKIQYTTLERIMTCICGCGQTWVNKYTRKRKRIYFHQRCRLHHIKNQIKSWERKPDKFIRCAQCQILTPIYNVLTSFVGQERRVCYDIDCVKAYRIRRMTKAIKDNSEAREAALNWKNLGAKDNRSAPKHHRSSYCKQIPEGKYEKVMCATYQETCSAGCYRTDSKGNPICFKHPAHVNSQEMRRPALAGAGVPQMWIRLTL